MKSNNSFKTALFLDRDGIINRDFGYVYEKDKLELVDGITELIGYFAMAMDHVIVVSNQSGIGRGFYTYKDWQNFNREIQMILELKDVKIDAFYCCPHMPAELNGESCYCRKPNPGMLLTAKNDFSLNLKQSILVGDKLSDIKAAYRANLLKAYLLSAENTVLSNQFHNFDVNVVKSLRDIIYIENTKSGEN